MICAPFSHNSLNLTFPAELSPLARVAFPRRRQEIRGTGREGVDDHQSLHGTGKILETYARITFFGNPIQSLFDIHVHPQLNDHLFKPVPGSRQTFYALYVLYYAGHGSKTDGSFEMERGQVVTLDAILNAWEQSAPYKANVSKLLIVADSCFSGKLVEELRKRAIQRVTRMTDAARTVAIQASCGPNEVAWDGHYIPAYLHHIEKTQRTMPRQLSIIADSQLTKQRPVFYCPWGGGEISTGTKGKPIPFFTKGS